MGRRRMIDRRIVYSKQVNQLSDDFTRLVFTWIIPFLDDFGKIEGDPYYIYSMIMSRIPTASEERVAKALEELDKCRLINWYEIDGSKYIEYPNFDRYQTGLTKRTSSKFPENPANSQKVSEIHGNSPRTEHNLTEVNSTEAKVTEVKDFANSIDPTTFIPNNSGESAAYEAWKRLEPDNSLAFHTTYMWALNKGLPESLFFEYTSEISQDKNIKNKGAVFLKKVKDYFENTV